MAAVGENPAADLPELWELPRWVAWAEVLRSTLDLGVLDVVDRAESVAALASSVGVEPEVMRYLLEVLVAMGLIERVPAHEEQPHRTTETARRYLVRDGASFCGDALRGRLASFLGLGQRIRGSAGTAAGPSWRRDDAWRLAQEQAVTSAAAAGDVAALIPGIEQRQRFLDVGGGPGGIAIALARNYPALAGEVLDQSAPAAVAQQQILAAGLEDRLRARPADLDGDELGTGLDLIWCSAVLHFVAARQDLIRRMAAALAPDGVLVCAHAELPVCDCGDPQTLAAYGPLVLAGHWVPREGDVSGLLAGAGLRVIQRAHCAGPVGAPLRVLIAQREVL